MKILIDMNIPLAYTVLLEKRGIESIRWSDVGLPNASDAEIMSYARENDMIVLTYDLDFSAILSVTHNSKPSVIQIRATIKSAERAVSLIVDALLLNIEEMEKGAILSIDMKKSRLRLLPL